MDLVHPVNTVMRISRQKFCFFILFDLFLFQIPLVFLLTAFFEKFKKCVIFTILRIFYGLKYQINVTILFSSNYSFVL